MPDRNENLVKRIDMAIHVQTLAAQHSIMVEFTLDEPSNGYHAQRNPRKIKIRPTKNTGFYVSALHEIGHIIGKHQTDNDPCQRLQSERREIQEFWAWVWAKRNALAWTHTAERVMWGAMNSYGITEETLGNDLTEILTDARTEELADA